MGGALNGRMGGESVDEPVLMDDMGDEGDWNVSVNAGSASANESASDACSGRMNRHRRR